MSKTITPLVFDYFDLKIIALIFLKLSKELFTRIKKVIFCVVKEIKCYKFRSTALAKFTQIILSDVLFFIAQSKASEKKFRH